MSRVLFGTKYVFEAFVISVDLQKLLMEGVAAVKQNNKFRLLMNVTFVFISPQKSFNYFI